MKILFLVIGLFFFSACSNKQLYNTMQDVQNNKNKYEARKKGIVLDNRNDKNISYERYKKESLNK